MLINRNKILKRSSKYKMRKFFYINPMKSIHLNLKLLNQHSFKMKSKILKNT